MITSVQVFVHVNFSCGPYPWHRQPSLRRPSSSTSHRGCRSRPAAGARGRPEAYLCRPLPLAQKLDSTDYSQIYAANSKLRLHHSVHKKDVRINDVKDGYSRPASDPLCEQKHAGFDDFSNELSHDSVTFATELSAGYRP